MRAVIDDEFTVQLPKELCKALHLNPGQQIELVAKDGVIVLRPSKAEKDSGNSQASNMD